MLLTEGLHVNESKMEKYHIQIGGEEDLTLNYSTLKKISKGEKDLQLIPTRHSNLFSAAGMSVKKSR